MWINNYDIEPHRLGFSEFHRDSTFTYFKDPKHSFRVLNTELNKIDYKAIDGSALKEKLYDEILPMKDKIDIEVIKCEIGGRKGFDDFKCTFIEIEQALSFHFTYFVKCDFFYKFKKSYSAKYNINIKELTNTTKNTQVKK